MLLNPSVSLLKTSRTFPLKQLFSLAVNPKKDSENTPVKGGTVADLGKNKTRPSIVFPVLTRRLDGCLY